MYVRFRLMPDAAVEVITVDASPPFQSSGASALRGLPPAGCPSNGETVVRLRKERSDKRSDKRSDEGREKG
jgi:hypothetical protein